MRLPKECGMPMKLLPERLKPKFGDLILNKFAGVRNPQRIGVYVETITRRCGLQVDINLRMTDTHGEFWEHDARSNGLSIIKDRSEDDGLAVTPETTVKLGDE